MLLTDGGGDDSDNGQVANGGDNGGDDNGGDGLTPTPTFPSKLPDTDETVSPNVTPPSDVEVVEPPPGFNLAIPGSVESECQTQTAAAVLNWQVAEPRGDQQVDVSVFDEFVPGNYLSSQVLASNTDSLTWQGLIPGALYHWRISTRINNAWVASESGQFQTEGCPQLDEAQTSALWRTR